MKPASRIRSLVARSVVFLAALSAASVVSRAQTIASDRDQIYILQQSAGDASAVQSQPYALTPLGTLAGARTAAAPEVGGHILVLTAEGRVWAWGDNRNAQLGIGSSAPQDGWVAIESIRNVSAIAAGTSHSVALKKRRHRLDMGRESSRPVRRWDIDEPGAARRSIPVERHVGDCGGLAVHDRIAFRWNCLGIRYELERDCTRRGQTHYPGAGSGARLNRNRGNRSPTGSRLCQRSARENLGLG